MRIRKYVPVKPAGGFPDHESFTVKERACISNR